MPILQVRGLGTCFSVSEQPWLCSFSYPDVGRAPPLGKECREALGQAGGFQDLGEEAGTRLPA